MGRDKTFVNSIDSLEKLGRCYLVHRLHFSKSEPNYAKESDIPVPPVPGDMLRKTGPTLLQNSLALLVRSPVDGAGQSALLDRCDTQSLLEGDQSNMPNEVSAVDAICASKWVRSWFGIKKDMNAYCGRFTLKALLMGI